MSVSDPIKYFKEKGCNYYYEYDESYGSLDLKDKVVVHVGGDCGSSVYYFLLHGARYVIFYEKNTELLRKYRDVCKELKFCEKVEAKGEWRPGEYPDGDVFIMDCEGCEAGVDLNALSKYSLACIAVHAWTPDKASLLKNMYGWRLQYVSNDGQELMFCR
jgi:hypothetical protein